MTEQSKQQAEIAGLEKTYWPPTIGLIIQQAPDRDHVDPCRDLGRVSALGD